MATNPNNAIGTNAAFGGRTSPNAFNDVLGTFQGRGIVSGWECSPDSGMTIVLGGNGTTRDVAIAEDNAGNKTTVDNIPASPISLTIAAAPATQSRIDAVVVYVNNPPQGSSTAVDNYGTVGILDVQGTVASSPVAPNDSDIRTAITTDGASGATAYYVVLAYITVGSGITTLTSAEIEAGPSASLQSELTNVPDRSITSDKIDWTTIEGSDSIKLGNLLIQWGTYTFTGVSWVDWWTDYQRTDTLTIPLPIAFSSLPTYVNIQPISGRYTFWSSIGQSTSPSELRASFAKPDGQGGDPSSFAVLWMAIGEA